MPLPTDGELRTWSILYTSVGEGYIGSARCTEGMTYSVSPVYVMVGGYQVESGRVMRQLMTFPVEMLADQTSLDVAPSAVLHLCELSDADFAILRPLLLRALGIAEECRANTRAVRSGIVMAPVGAKLPPSLLVKP